MPKPSLGLNESQHTDNMGLYSLREFYSSGLTNSKLKRQKTGNSTNKTAESYKFSGTLLKGLNIKRIVYLYLFIKHMTGTSQQEFSWEPAKKGAWCSLSSRWRFDPSTAQKPGRVS